MARRVRKTDRRTDAKHDGGWTLDEIGVLLGVSREMIRHYETRALQSLQKTLLAEGLSFDDLFGGRE